MGDGNEKSFDSGSALFVGRFFVLPRTGVGPVARPWGGIHDAGIDPEPRFPNAARKSILTPTGWDAAYNTVCGGMGYQSNGPSGSGSDVDWGFGVGLGDPVLLIGVQISGTVPAMRSSA